MNDDKKNWPHWLKNAETQNADVSIDSSHRITPSKCCGSCTTFKSWKLSPAEWADLAKRALAESLRAGGRRKK